MSNNLALNFYPDLFCVTSTQSQIRLLSVPCRCQTQSWHSMLLTLFLWLELNLNNVYLPLTMCRESLFSMVPYSRYFFRPISFYLCCDTFSIHPSPFFFLNAFAIKHITLVYHLIFLCFVILFKKIN